MLGMPASTCGMPWSHAPNTEQEAGVRGLPGQALSRKGEGILGILKDHVEIFSARFQRKCV